MCASPFPPSPYSDRHRNRHGGRFLRACLLARVRRLSAGVSECLPVRRPVAGRVLVAVHFVSAVAAPPAGRPRPVVNLAARRASRARRKSALRRDCGAAMPRRRRPRSWRGRGVGSIGVPAVTPNDCRHAAQNHLRDLAVVSRPVPIDPHRSHRLPFGQRRFASGSTQASSVPNPEENGGMSRTAWIARGSDKVNGSGLSYG